MKFSLSYTLILYIHLSINIHKVLALYHKFGKSHVNVYYTVKGDESNPKLLLIPGFGTGTFHYDKQYEVLSEKFQVFSMDLLGQGYSWPSVIYDDDKLAFNADLWSDQIIDFAENVIKEPCHIGGNSLGGYLSIVANDKCTKLWKSIILFNATPFWGWRPNEDSLLTSMIWDGTLPAPESYLNIGAKYFDAMRNEENINKMLAFVYSNKNAFDNQLANNIIEGASTVDGPKAFTSIVFAPKYRKSFEEMLLSVSKPILMIYGENDPMITPFWGKKAYKSLSESNSKCVSYFQLSNSGHCPHHESWKTVNTLLSGWIQEYESLKYTNNDNDNELFEKMKLFDDFKTLEESGSLVTSTLLDKSKIESNLVDRFLFSVL